MYSAPSNKPPSVTESVMSSYRTSFGGARNGTTRGMQDEVMDASINFGDEVSFGSTNLHGNHHDGMNGSSKSNGGTNGNGNGTTVGQSQRGSTHKRMVDVFLADDPIDGEHASVVGMQQTERGAKVKKAGFYVCLAIILVVILVLAPKPGFIFGKGGRSDSDSDTIESNSINGTDPTELPWDNSTSETVAPIQEEEEVSVSLPSTDVHFDMDRSEAIRVHITSTLVTLPHELARETSPASLAVKWLASQDEAKMDIPGYAHNSQQTQSTNTTVDESEMSTQLLQRYALAIVYFSMQKEFMESVRRLDSLDDNNKQGELRGQPKQQQRSLFDETEITAFDNNRNVEFKNTWTDHKHVCDWFGVECDDLDHIVAVNLTHSLLEGRLPAELFHETALPAMVSLDMSFNGIFGIFHNQRNPNTVLETIHLEHNQMTGNIDTLVMSGFPGLINLDANSNMFTGVLPENWEDLPQLEFLRLNGNDIQGTLPPSIGTISNLEWLQMNDNKFSGSIPESWSALSMLHTIRLSNNPITGTLPAFLADLPMDHLSLHDTELTGEVPSEFGRMTDLTNMFLQSTKLGGTMPAEVCTLIETGATLTKLFADCDTEMECDCCTNCY